MNARPTLKLKQSTPSTEPATQSLRALLRERPTPAVERFWFIWNPDAYRPSVRHATLEIAQAEAERLTEIHGIGFCVYEATLCRKD